MAGLSEQQIARAWHKLYAQVDAWQQRTGDEELSASWEVQAGSALDADDRAANPYQVSHAARQALIAAVDHQHAVVALIRDAQTLHTWSPYTLLRGAIETAATAMWLLAPDNGQERLQRRLRLMAKDAAEGDEAAREAGLTPRRPMSERRRQLQDIARHNGLHPTQSVKKPTSTGIVREAEAASGSRVHVLTAWRVGSGFAHGRVWSMLSMLDKAAMLPGEAGDVYELRVTNSLDRVLWCAWAAEDVTRAAIGRYDRLRQSAV